MNRRHKSGSVFGSFLGLAVLAWATGWELRAASAELIGVKRIWDAAPRPDVRFEVIPGAGHVCNVEKPVAYNRHLLSFLGRLP